MRLSPLQFGFYSDFQSRCGTNRIVHCKMINLTFAQKKIFQNSLTCIRPSIRNCQWYSMWYGRPHCICQSEQHWAQPVNDREDSQCVWHRSMFHHHRTNHFRLWSLPDCCTRLWSICNKPPHVKYDGYAQQRDISNLLEQLSQTIGIGS